VAAAAQTAAGPRGLPCPECGADRPLTIGTERVPGGVRRRRQCRGCARRWSTIELAA
jgi:transcriptional regulator NrdR family protein